MKFLPSKINVMANFFIIDDHFLMLEGLRTFLLSFSNFKVDRIYQSPLKALSEIDKVDTSDFIFIIDIKMNELSGIDIISILNRKNTNTKIIAFSFCSERETIYEAIRAGALAYVTESQIAEELLNAISYVSKGEYYYNNLFNLEDHLRINNTTAFNISEREFEFIKLNASDLTYKEIAKNMNLSIKTIENYRDNLYGKFKCKTRTGLVVESFKRRLINPM